MYTEMVAACLTDNVIEPTTWKCLRCGCMWAVTVEVCPVCVGEVMVGVVQATHICRNCGCGPISCMCEKYKKFFPEKETDNGT